jgi:flagellar assembly protein FliH
MSDSGRTTSAGATAIERWSIPAVEGDIIGRQPDNRRAAAAAEAREQRIRQESEARGYEAGMERAKAETQERIAKLDRQVKQLDAVLQLIGRPLQDLDAEVEKMLLDLALTVGKQLARRELRVDPTQVIAIMRESLELLPAAAREIRVQLHPEDAAIVRERLTAPTDGRAWTLVEDPTLSRGGCRILTENSQIDARFESRINTVIANALGDERAQDRPTDAATADSTPAPQAEP